MEKWKQVFFVSVAIIALCFAGCCGPQPEKYEPSLTTEQVTPPPPPPVEEEEEVVPPPPEPTLTESAMKAGALKTIYFEFDKSALTPSAINKLDKTAAWLAENPEAKIQVEGHCDERGTNEYNMALGERRANSAKKYLVNMGVSSDRIATVSYGEEQPVDPGHNEAAWAKNRRCEFNLVM